MGGRESSSFSSALIGCFKSLSRLLVHSCLRLLLFPWRWKNHRRDGQVETAGRHELPNDVLLGLVRDKIREGSKDGQGQHFEHHKATIWVKGYSMRPFLEHMRDKVLLAYPQRPLEVGDAVLAEITPGHYVLHRIISLEGEHVTLMGDGNLRGTEHCRLQDVVGIVEEYIRPKRTIPASDPQLIRNIQRWRRLLPYRRWLLLIYKATV